MALSRLRQPVISRAPALLRARLLASVVSSRSHPRFSTVNHFVADNGSLLRPSSLSMIIKSQDGLIRIKSLGGSHYASSAEVPLHTVLEMPALSPTMSQGNIAKWLKKEGDKVDVGDILCEIETDKATVEFECLEEGYLAKILVLEGSKDIPVGQPIAIMVEELDDIQNIPATVGTETEVKEDDSVFPDTASKDEHQETSAVQINTSDLPPHAVLDMPALSPTMEKGNVAKWRKKEGDKIDVGDVICEIETDKATLEFESLEEGFLAKILAPEGLKDVAVGQPIAVTVEDADDIEAVRSSFSGGVKMKEEKLAPHGTKTAVKEQNCVSRISPSAKLLIAEFGLDESSLKASGPHGTLLKGDVLAAIKSGKGSSRSQSKEKPTPSPQIKQSSSPPTSVDTVSQLSNSYDDLPNSQIRKVIARRLLESKQTTPHLYLSTDVVLDPLLSFRKELIERHKVKVSVNDIIIKAVAVALRNVPEANASWNVDKGELELNDSVDISIAVATEKGLMTPIVRNADQKTISAISVEVKELAEKARGGKLMPHEFQGGTFSISNLGMFPVDHFCAIINPPQAGILAVGRGNSFVVPVIGSDGIEKPAIVSKMKLTLSADHRVFDGKVGGAFLSALRENFSDIQRLML